MKMYKYAVAHSLLMITSISLVVAVKPFHVVRQGGILDPSPPSSPPAQATPPTTPPVSTPATPPTAPSTTPAVSPPSSPATPPTTPAASISQSTTLSSSTSAPSTSVSAPPSSQAPTNSPISTSTPSVSSFSTTSTDAAGQETVIVTESAADSATSSTPSPSPTNSSSDNSLKPGSIIGLSVAGGIAAIALIAFIVWKLTRKRFSDLDDPDEAIKWPELNNRESHVGTVDDGISRQPSNTYSSAPSRNASTLDQSEYADPYAVPPLPQFNPNQPYRDDPAAYGAAGGYYDPYRGPIPQTFHDESVDGHESIPMSTYPPGSRTRSPGPGTAYDVGGRGSPAPGRASPGPGAAYDTGGRGSPAPVRTISPGPAAALGLDRRPSPGPQYGLGQPEMVARNKSPGPNILA